VEEGEDIAEGTVYIRMTGKFLPPARLLTCGDVEGAQSRIGRSVSWNTV